MMFYYQHGATWCFVTNNLFYNMETLKLDVIRTNLFKKNGFKLHHYVMMHIFLNGGCLWTHFQIYVLFGTYTFLL